MPDKKSKAGRPKHVAEFKTGSEAQKGFADAMRVIVSAPKKPLSKRGKKSH